MKLSEKIVSIVFVLIITGLVVALYLTFLHYTHTSAMCGSSETFSNCDMVLQSKYAELLGVPIAFFGVIFYTMLLIIFLNIVYRKDTFFVDLMFTFEIAGSIFSALLIYTQIALIGALCPYCVTSAVVTTLLFFISLYLKLKEKEV